MNSINFFKLIYKDKKVLLCIFKFKNTYLTFKSNINKDNTNPIVR